MNRRGQVRLGALIAAGLVLGGTNASASPIEDNHNITVTDGSQRAVYGGNAELRHDNGDGTASASSNTLTVRSNDELGFLAGGWVEYQRYDNATAPGATTLTASGNTVTLTTGKTTHLYGGNIRVYSTQGGPVTYRTNENTILVNAGGTQIGDLYGAHIEQKAAGAGTSFAAEAKKNRVTNTGGAINHATAASVDLIGTDATRVSVTVDDNDVIGTGGTYSYVFGGGFGSIKTDSGAAETTVTNNDITIDGGTLKDGFSAGGGFARAETGNGAAEAHADKNTVTLRNSSSTNGGYSGGTAYALPSGGRATATANENAVTITGGAYSYGRSVIGGSATVRNGAGTILATANANRVTLSPTGAIWEEIRGGRALADATAAASTATASGNILTLNAGSFGESVYGGDASASSSSSTAVAAAESNELHIGGGSYKNAIYGGRATTDGSAGTSAVVRGNIIEITGAPNLSKAELHGGTAAAANVTRENNALIVRETKGITAASIADFQRLAFYVPAGMTADDTMLRVTSSANTNLSGTALEAYLPGSSTANRLRLLYTENAQIDTDGATTMTVYEGVSGHRTAKMGVTTNKKELIVKVDGSAIDGGTTPPPNPNPNPNPNPGNNGFVLHENTKSLAETMTGTAAFLGASGDLIAGGGMQSASAEAAGAGGFAPFAAIGGSSLRHETGSHVTVRGMNLVVGFSREIVRGNDRLLFGPIVEYGRGSYDSYLNDDTHGEGDTHYVGGGLFLRQEQQRGMFYEGSLRFGRMSTDYEANLPISAGITRHTSYDTDANYIGAHLGVGHTAKAENGTERTLYLRYFYTRQNGAGATLSTGDRYDFHAVDSHRLRTGARWTIPQGSGALVLGTSLQYEFKGEAGATYHTGGFSYDTPAPSLKGLSASLELGWKAPLSRNATADIGVEGWVGKQRGVTCKAGLDWRF